MLLEKKLNKIEQQKLLSDLYRLAKAGLKQRDVAEQLTQFGDPIQRKIGRQIIKALNNGDVFATALKPWLTMTAWETLAANESTGQWASGLKHAQIAVATENAATVELIKALLTPTAGFVVLIYLSGLNATTFLPLLSKLVPENRWGQLSHLAQNIGMFNNMWGIHIIGLCATVLALAVITLPWFRGTFRTSIDNFPLYRQYRLIKVSVLLRSLSHLSLAGFGLQDSITHLKRNATPYISDHLLKMQNNIKQGETNLGRIMDTGILNRAEQHSMLILGDIGGASETLSSCADIHHDLLLSEIKTIKEKGALAIKLCAMTIGGIAIGGIGQILLLIPSTLHI